MICQISPMNRKSSRHPSLLRREAKDLAPEYSHPPCEGQECSELVSQVLRQQANRGNSRGVHHINDPGNHTEFDRRIAPDKRSAVSAQLEDFPQPPFQILPRYGFLIDAQRTVRENLYHNWRGFVSPAILGSRDPARL